MQLPTITTPIARCLELAAYTARMLEKFSGQPELVDLAQRMNAGEQAHRRRQLSTPRLNS